MWMCARCHHTYVDVWVFYALVENIFVLVMLCNLLTLNKAYLHRRKKVLNIGDGGWGGAKGGGGRQHFSWLETNRGSPSPTPPPPPPHTHAHLANNYSLHHSIAKSRIELTGNFYQHLQIKCTYIIIYIKKLRKLWLDCWGAKGYVGSVSKIIVPSPHPPHPVFLRL